MNSEKNIITLTYSKPKYRLESIKQFIIKNKIKYEVQIKKAGFLRIGIAHENARKLMPVGSDKNGFSISNRGYSFWNGVQRNFCDSFIEGDIIGVEVCLKTTESNISYLRFYKNGIEIGVAFWNIPYDSMYPAFSFYGNCEIEVNFSEFQVYFQKDRYLFSDV